MTKRQLTKFGIDFTEVPLTAALADEFKTQGFMAAPIVVAGTSTWSGFKFERIKALSAHIFGDKHV
jgi:glutaredoxin-like protein NrdH